MGDEEIQRHAARERQLERGLEDRAQVRAEVRVGVLGFDRRAAHLEGQQSRGVRDLLGEIDLEVTDHLAACFAPAAHGREVGVLEQLLAGGEHAVEVAALPFREHGLAVHRCLHTGGRLARNASSPSTGSLAAMRLVT
jgi:hypothetical protein